VIDMSDDHLTISELMRRDAVGDHVERKEPPRREENKGYNDDDATEATRLEKRYNKVRPPKAIAPQPALDVRGLHPFIGIHEIDQRIARGREGDREEEREWVRAEICEAVMKVITPTSEFADKVADAMSAIELRVENAELRAENAQLRADNAEAHRGEPLPRRLHAH
jgi:hypothetical protein